jgi:hypothetical protein
MSGRTPTLLRFRRTGNPAECWDKNATRQLRDSGPCTRPGGRVQGSRKPEAMIDMSQEPTFGGRRDLTEGGTFPLVVELLNRRGGWGSRGLDTAP